VAAPENPITGVDVDVTADVETNSVPCKADAPRNNEVPTNVDPRTDTDST